MLDLMLDTEQAQSLMDEEARGTAGHKGANDRNNNSSSDTASYDTWTRTIIIIT